MGKEVKLQINVFTDDRVFIVSCSLCFRPDCVLLRSIKIQCLVICIVSFCMDIKNVPKSRVLLSN